jgi:hypothetical protein
VSNPLLERDDRAYQRTAGDGMAVHADGKHLRRRRDELVSASGAPDRRTRPHKEAIHSLSEAASVGHRHNE